jgi:hypothetical protein
VQATAGSDADMVLWWAPIIYQQDDGQNPMARENTFTAVNYDRDWRANNNWENLPYYPPGAAVYYSLVESDTHYFIGYYLYYPRHTGGTKHEHDMGGVLAVVQKGADKFGQLELLLIYNNNEWLKLSGSHVRRENGHPILVVSTGTHEISNEREPGPGGAYPMPLTSGQSTAPAHGGYRLVDLQELWQHRNDIGQNRTFNRWGYFDSDYLNVAAPWVWEYHRINWLAKPAEMLQRIHDTANQTVKYLNNPYAGI